jgi:acetylornithine aminotransferase/acetylornithine/N-succinyldiaminopimelate aminotransferase
VFFTNSGTESVEGALKFARLFANATPSGRKKHRFLALEGAFHGRTMGALSATHSPTYREPFEPLLAGFAFVKFNDTADLERLLDDDVAALLIETVQGEGGIRLVSSDFYSAARRLTRERGALLIADEVQCGLGRTGRWLAVHKYADPRSPDLLPDLVTLAKPLGGGLPMGAVLVADHVAAKVQPGMHGHTFAGGPLACRVSLELLRTIENEGLIAHAREIGAYFLDRLQAFREHPLVRDVRGDGLMLALELSVPSRPVVTKLLEAGYITNSTSGTVLRLLPPLIIRRKQVDKFLPALKATLDEVGQTA